MQITICHPGTQHSAKLAEALNEEGILGGLWTGLRFRSDSPVLKRFRISGNRVIPQSIAPRTHQLRAQEIAGMLLQKLGLPGESTIRWRNGWFQSSVPRQAITSCNGVVGFDTSSWLLARRAKQLGKPFLLDRTTIHRTSRIQIRRQLLSVSAGQRSSDPLLTDVQGRLETEEMELAARVIVASEFARDSLIPFGVPGAKIVVIPYGVDSSRFAQRKENRESKPVFLYVGNLTAEKGVHVLLAAWKELQSQTAELWFAGPANPEIIETARGIPGVRLLGKLDPERLLAAYQAASAFVFPTLYDGFGLVLLEAMACGLPVIATPSCAAPELIGDNSAGSLCTAGSTAELAAAMADVISNPRAWALRGIAAREIAQGYSWQAYGSRWATLLREVIN